MSNWYLQNGKESDVVVSTRVRLARNIAGHNFENNADSKEKEEILRDVEGIIPNIGYNLQMLKLKDIDDVSLQALVEENIISPDFVEDKDDKKAIVINPEENICIMVNEEDHMRIQVFSEGFAIDELLNLATEVDRKIEKNIDYAFSEKYGYLTACPTNVGTGIRISVMVHLPALAKTRNLNKLLQIVNNLGMTVRGVYGEGSKSIGDMYQISNKQTLGITEQEISKNMKAIIEKIIEQERTARKYLTKNSIDFEDEIYRAYGILTNARKISTEEAEKLMSTVKLGTDLGIISELDDTKIKKMMLYIKPANLQKYYGKIMEPLERDVQRAKIIKEISKK